MNWMKALGYFLLGVVMLILGGMFIWQLFIWIWFVGPAFIAFLIVYGFALIVKNRWKL